MKLFLPLLACLLLAGPATAENGKKQRFLVAIADICPYQCADDPENPGFLVEMVRALFEGSSYEPVFRPFPWSRAMTMTRTGRAIALLSPARIEAPDLVYPAANIGIQRQCIFVAKSSSLSYSGPHSLIGVKTLYLRDALPPGLMQLEQEPTFIAKSYNADFTKQAAAMLSVARINAFIMLDTPAVHYLMTNDLAGDVRIEHCFEEQQLYLAFSPTAEHEELVRDLAAIHDRRYREIQNSPLHRRLRKKYNIDIPDALY